VTTRQIGRVTVLTNPASGHGNAPHAAEKAVARLQQRGIDVVAIVGSANCCTPPSTRAPTRWSWSAATA
jgi:hypothetical protein